MTTQESLYKSWTPLISSERRVRKHFPSGFFEVIWQQVALADQGPEQMKWAYMFAK